MTSFLLNLVELDNVYWGGKKSGKRGRDAAGKTPFLAAISHNDKGHPVYMRMSKLGSFTSDEINHWTRKASESNPTSHDYPHTVLGSASVIISIIYTEGDYTYSSNLKYDCLFFTSLNNNKYFVSFKKG